MAFPHDFHDGPGNTASGVDVMDNLNYLLSLISGITAGVTPIGQITEYAGSTDPAGGLWLVCDGRAVGRLTYSALFAICGTTYGVGDGSSTFNIPDMRGRVPIGKGTPASPAVTGGTAKTLGTKGGTETHVHTGVAAAHTHTGNCPSHTHSGNCPSHTHSGNVAAHSHGGATGSGTPALLDTFTGTVSTAQTNFHAIAARGPGAGGDHSHAIGAEAPGFTTGGPSSTAWTSGGPSATAWTTSSATPALTIDPVTALPPWTCVNFIIHAL